MRIVHERRLRYRLEVEMLPSSGGALGRKLDNGEASNDRHEPLPIADRILRGDFDA